MQPTTLVATFFTGFKNLHHELWYSVLISATITRRFLCDTNQNHLVKCSAAFQSGWIQDCDCQTVLFHFAVISSSANCRARTSLPVPHKTNVCLCLFIDIVYVCLSTRQARAIAWNGIVVMNSDSTKQNCTRLKYVVEKIYRQRNI